MASKHRHQHLNNKHRQNDDRFSTLRLMISLTTQWPAKISLLFLNDSRHLSNVLSSKTNILYLPYAYASLSQNHIRDTTSSASVSLSSQMCLCYFVFRHFTDRFVLPETKRTSLTIHTAHRGRIVMLFIYNVFFFLSAGIISYA